MTFSTPKYCCQIAPNLLNSFFRKIGVKYTHSPSKSTLRISKNDTLIFRNYVSQSF